MKPQNQSHQKQASTESIKRRGFIKNRANHKVSASIDSLKEIITDESSEIEIKSRPFHLGSNSKEPTPPVSFLAPDPLDGYSPKYGTEAYSPKYPAEGYSPKYAPVEKTNAYFRRVSMLPANYGSRGSSGINGSSNVHETHRELLMKVARKLLFTFSEIYQTFKTFNQINSHDKLQETISSVLSQSKKKIHKLVEAIERCEATGSVSNLVHGLGASVHVFRSLAAQMAENLSALTRKSDVCFIRVLLLSLFGCFAELANASTVMSGGSNTKTLQKAANVVPHSATSRKFSDKSIPSIIVHSGDAIAALEVSCTTALAFLAAVEAAPPELRRSAETQCHAVHALAKFLLDFQLPRKEYVTKLDSLVKANIQLLAVMKQMIPYLKDSGLRSDAASLSKHTRGLIRVVESEGG